MNERASECSSIVNIFVILSTNWLSFDIWWEWVPYVLNFITRLVKRLL